MSYDSIILVALGYLNSELLKGRFYYGLSQETPPGWTPYYDYSIIYGYHIHSPLKTKELMEDDSLPFKKMIELHNFMNEKWFELRIRILLKEITETINAEFNVSLIGELSSPDEWFQKKKAKLFPIHFTRFHYMRLLRAFFYYGLYPSLTIEENFNFLISKCSLENNDKELAIIFLSLLYNRCKISQPSLLFDNLTVNNELETNNEKKQRNILGGKTKKVSVSWISDNYVKVISSQLLLLQNVRTYMRQLTTDQLRSRIECCPPWTVALHNWNSEKDMFLLKIVEKYGFSSLIQFFTDESSKLAAEQNEPITVEMLKLRRVEELEAMPALNCNQKMMKCRFLFRHENRSNRVRQLVEHFSCPLFETKILGLRSYNQKDIFAIIKIGVAANRAKQALFGYFAFRILHNEKRVPFLFAFTIGGSISQPIYQIHVREKPQYKTYHMLIEETLRRFRKTVEKDEDLPKIPEAMTGQMLFGLEEQVTVAIKARM